MNSLDSFLAFHRVRTQRDGARDKAKVEIEIIPGKKMEITTKAVEHIVQGWFNSWIYAMGLADPEKAKEWERRAKICAACDTRNVKKNTCSICGCPIKKLTKSDKMCSLKKF